MESVRRMKVASVSVGQGGQHEHRCRLGCCFQLLLLLLSLFLLIILHYYTDSLPFSPISFFFSSLPRSSLLYPIYWPFFPVKKGINFSSLSYAAVILSRTLLLKLSKVINPVEQYLLPVGFVPLKWSSAYT